MKIIDLFNNKPKSITIINTSYNIISDTDKVKFKIDLYKQNYKEVIQKMFPQYNIEFDVVDDEIFYNYPKINGNINRLQKDEILKAMDSPPLDTLHAEDKYYKPDIKFTGSFNNDKKDKPKTNHVDDSRCIIDGTYDLSNLKKRKLTSYELYFLKYIAVIKSNPLDYIAGDWTFDYHLNYQDVLNQFVGQGLLEIEELSLCEKISHMCKVNDLKLILRNKALSVTGLKAVLVDRIIENSSEDELKEYDNKRYIRYKLTEKGKILTDPLNPSMTRDMELEDKCYQWVLNNSIDKAYKAISDFKSQKDFPGLGFEMKIYESQDSKVGLSDKKLFKYRKLTNLNLDLPEDIKDMQKNIIACIIVGEMFGCESYKIINLIQRLINSGLDKEQIDKYVAYGLSCLREY